LLRAFHPEKTKLRYDLGDIDQSVKLGLVALAALFCLILFASPAFAAGTTAPSKDGGHAQPLSLTLQGEIVNAGSQNYQFHGGQLIEGTVNGKSITSTHLSFDLQSSVHGLSVSGRGDLELSPGHDDQSEDAVGSNLNMQITITGAVPAAIFPITLTSSSTYSNCNPSSQSCNSEIPLLFTGVATIHSGGGHDSTQIPIGIESPYWNPLGGPIVITSLDNPTNPSIFLIVTYDSASIGWSGVQLQGVLAGTYGTKSVTGYYSQSVFSQENLLAGTEFDAGTIAFAGMSDPTLNAHGGFLGHTTFTLAGGFDCSSEFQLPKGTCTATGATSDGSFLMGGSGATIVGTYHTIWSVPSLFTQTTVLGAVIQH
jgi:hypothetical protein